MGAAGCHSSDAEGPHEDLLHPGVCTQPNLPWSLLSFCYLLLAQDSVGLWAVTGHQWLSLTSVINSWGQLR